MDKDKLFFCPRCDKKRTRRPKYALFYAGPQRTVVHGESDGSPTVIHFCVDKWYCPHCFTDYFESVSE